MGVIVYARFAGKVILITGATSGMGWATAERVAGEGAKLVLVARGREVGEALVADIRAAGGEAFFVPADVTVEAETAEAVGGALSRYGRLDGASTTRAPPLRTARSRRSTVRPGTRTWSSTSPASSTP